MSWPRRRASERTTGDLADSKREGIHAQRQVRLGKVRPGRSGGHLTAGSVALSCYRSRHVFTFFNRQAMHEDVVHKSQRIE